MIDNWQKSLNLVLQSEGGFSDNPYDPGGVTNLGVTQRVWESWVGRPSGLKEMQSLTLADVAPLYKAKYWNACQCDNLPAGVDYVVFDFAVNAGVGRSIKTLQTVVGVTPDGSLGPVSMSRVSAMQPADVVRSLSDAKDSFYHSLPTFPQFGRGWLARVNDVEANALKMVT